MSVDNRMKQMWICPTCNKRRMCKLISAEIHISYGQLTKVESTTNQEQADVLILQCKKCLTKFETDNYGMWHNIISLPNAEEILNKVKL